MKNKYNPKKFEKARKSYFGIGKKSSGGKKSSAVKKAKAEDAGKV